MPTSYKYVEVTPSPKQLILEFHSNIATGNAPEVRFASDPTKTMGFYDKNLELVCTLTRAIVDMKNAGDRTRFVLRGRFEVANRPEFGNITTKEQLPRVSLIARKADNKPLPNTDGGTYHAFVPLDVPPKSANMSGSLTIHQVTRNALVDVTETARIRLALGAFYFRYNA